MKREIPDVARKNNERPEIIIRRFTRLIQEIGLLRTVKEIREYRKPLNRKAKRELALRAAKIRQEKRGYKT